MTCAVRYAQFVSGPPRAVCLVKFLADEFQLRVREGKTARKGRGPLRRSGGTLRSSWGSLRSSRRALRGSRRALRGSGCGLRFIGGRLATDCHWQFGVGGG